ncbi:plasmid partitioning protein RepB (plasmid) [Rhizobium sp. ACO-34A]|nr:plasmid partitioning protein RepB [Rhizobium sp. ACO-34A]ATN37429.1 plasmid partitioning protein RepB [Rhizobium sp. ACO-34A]
MAGRDRKNSLKALFGGDMLPAAETEHRAPETKSVPGDTPATAATSQPAQESHSPTAPASAGHSSIHPGRTSSGAVRTMGLTLSSISREMEEARALREALENGERILALDPAKIEVSFVSDRLSEEDRDDPDFLQLVESMREAGQQVPILVRPHGETPDRYQVAYGHRRLKAARRLGLPVRAIVRTLSDDELVLAQGKENAERRNLSFIERAVFARSLEDRGFDRKLICEALAVQKSELSRLLQVADAVPVRFIRAIGPAPKAGRERWMALGEIFLNGNGAEIEKADDEATSERFRAADSDTRFQMLFDRALPVRLRKGAKAAPLELKAPDGRVFARVDRQGRAVKIDFAKDVAPAFIERMMARLNEDYAAFVAAEAAGESEA